MAFHANDVSYGQANIWRASELQLDLALEWGAIAGWNPGLHDAHCFLGIDPRGFVWAELDDEPVGCIGATAYSPTFGFIGPFLVRETDRHHGIGSQLWAAARTHLGSCRIGINAPLDHEKFLRSEGFNPVWRNMRFGGVGIEARPRDIIDLNTLPFTEVLNYDAGNFPAPRAEFLRRWITRPGTLAVGVMQEKGLAAMGVLRPCAEGHHIGPIYADDETLGDIIYSALAGAIPDRPFTIDVPEPSMRAKALAERHGLKPLREYTTWFSPDAPAMPWSRLYANGSLELG